MMLAAGDACEQQSCNNDRARNERQLGSHPESPGWDWLPECAMTDEGAEIPALGGRDDERAAQVGDNAGATDVPSAARAAELVAEGEHAESLGALDRAIGSFSEAARTDDPAAAAEA